MKHGSKELLVLDSVNFTAPSKVRGKGMDFSTKKCTITLNLFTFYATRSAETSIVPFTQCPPGFFVVLFKGLGSLGVAQSQQSLTTSVLLGTESMSLQNSVNFGPRTQV